MTLHTEMHTEKSLVGFRQLRSAMGKRYDEAATTVVVKGKKLGDPLAEFFNNNSLPGIGQGCIVSVDGGEERRTPLVCFQIIENGHTGLQAFVFDPAQGWIGHAYGRSIHGVCPDIPVMDDVVLSRIRVLFSTGQLTYTPREDGLMDKLYTLQLP